MAQRKFLQRGWGKADPDDKSDLRRVLMDRISIQDSGCWYWESKKLTNGYGRFRTRVGTTLAHRAVYEAFRGPIPIGTVLDHLCRFPGCVNPDHLESVTQRTNILRGESIAAKRAAQTSCVNGHPFTSDNIYEKALARGRRECKICTRNRMRKNFARKAALPNAEV